MGYRRGAQAGADLCGGSRQAGRRFLLGGQQRRRARAGGAAHPQGAQPGAVSELRLRMGRKGAGGGLPAGRAGAQDALVFDGFQGQLRGERLLQAEYQGDDRGRALGVDGFDLGWRQYRLRWYHGLILPDQRAEQVQNRILRALRACAVKPNRPEIGLSRGLTLTLRQGLYWAVKGGHTLDRGFYPAGQFARKAAVSIRTLRYYDQEGLLPPSRVTAAGYRLYTDADLVNLQQILALKFLGFSLEEIKALLRSEPRNLADVLAQQKAMMRAKRTQLDGIIHAITQAEQLLQAGECDWDSLVTVIQVIQMDQNKEWVNKYLTPEQQQQMQHLTEQSYSDADKEKLRARAQGWTAADQEQATAQWAAVWESAKRLTAAGADPAGPEGQALAQQHNALIAAFTGGDADLRRGLQQWWHHHDQLPAPQRPFQAPLTAPEQAFLDQALAAYRR
jgi:DNA-binding transcriptional MerR regulator